MPPPARRRKLQNPALLDALEAALAAGEPVDSALTRLRISRSTLKREMLRDEALRHRIEGALAGGGPQAPHPKKPAPAAAPPAPRAVPEAADVIPVGTGRVVFGSRRPRPLATVRRMALRSAPTWASERTARRREQLALHDWLPALFVLLVEAALAFLFAGIPVVGAVVLAIAGVYASAMFLLPGAPPPEPVTVTQVPVPDTPGWSRPEAPLPLTPPSGSVGSDLAWLRQTIGAPEPGARPPPHRRRNDRGA